MTDTGRKQLQKKILESIARMEKEVAHLEEATQPIAPENAIGRVSRMDAINNKSVSEAALRAARRKLYSLRLALTKIDSPAFGICSRCKKPIQPARLMFLPESTRCVHCSERG